MSGPEHYQEAERLAAIAVDDNYSERAQERALRLGRLHATLALAAATALGNSTPSDQTKWRLAMNGD